MTFDLTPLFRTSIGFDRMAKLVDQASRLDQAQNSYPPYNIEAVDENNYRITLALAGFGIEDLEITSEPNLLFVKGKKDSEQADVRYIYRGIATRSFERRFQLADHVKVKAAQMDNGLLHIQLEREIPEAMKPQKIEISGSKNVIDQKPELVDDSKKDVA